MDNDFNCGDIVLSKAGRDAGRYFIVLKCEENFAYISDGDLRKTDTPKRKKFRHLTFCGENSAFAADRIESGEKLTNTEIRREIREFCERNNI